MSENKSTRFQFNFAGVEIELEGKDEFVIEMYQKILSDVERAQGEMRLDSDTTNDNSLSKKIIWIHKCTPMMKKVYMSSGDELKKQPLLNFIDLQGVELIYCDEDAFPSILPEEFAGNTLWAELTTKGKMSIANKQDGKA